ncbi:MAG: adenylosuccinate synthase [Bacillota bacterium]|nr:adenylosuccinate synthase [Bacillota bacterium]NLV69272.1 adenylosuccinate synthase [Clostridiales bacterium]
MNTLAIVGSQWGDEGKGKMIDYFGKKADMVVRAQGGSNAGHSVVINGKRYSLHLVPSGILNPAAVNIVGNGVVFDPKVFFGEIDHLSEDGIATDKIFVSDRAHVVFPYHYLLDELYETDRGKEDIGTTKKGIGPCYMDKVQRSGIRTCDMLDAKKFVEKFGEQIDAKNQILEKLFDAPPLDKEAMIREYLDYAKMLAPYIRDTGVLVYEAIRTGKKVLFEGAQGSLLDIDLGTYPYVTSSHPTSGGFTTGSGIGIGSISDVLGIVKAYTTRVGKGPFVTELFDETGDRIREIGHEYGVTTGRPRRIGWFDAVIVNYSSRINGMTAVALMLLDVLSSFDTLQICYAYEHQGKRVDHYPADLDYLAECKPLYKEMPGWKTDISGCRTYEELPAACRAYVEEIEMLTGLPVISISIGPEREATIVRKEIF